MQSVVFQLFPEDDLFLRVISRSEVDEMAVVNGVIDAENKVTAY